MPVLVAQNNEAGPVVLSLDPKGSEYVEWMGKGDPNGDDLKEVPESIQNTVAFRKIVARGIVTVVDGLDDNPVLKAALERQQAAWERRKNASAQLTTDTMAPEHKNDMLSIECIGPGANGSKCGTDVPVREQTMYDKPPLCARHKDLAPEFIPEFTTEGGRQTVKWLRAGMTSREREIN